VISSFRSICPIRPAQPAIPTRTAPLLLRFGAGAAGFSGFLFLSNGLAAVGLAAAGLADFPAATFEAFGGVLRRNDLVAMQPPDTRGGI
jgi:hypothetical protein